MSLSCEDHNASDSREALVTILFLEQAFICVSVELVAVVFGGFFEVLPRALRSNLEATAWIGGPAEVPSIPMVVRVGIGV